MKDILIDQEEGQLLKSLYGAYKKSPDLGISKANIEHNDNVVYSLVNKQLIGFTKETLSLTLRGLVYCEYYQ